MDQNVKDLYVYDLFSKDSEEVDKPGIAMHTSNPSTQETEAEELQAQGQAGLHSEFKANLGFTGRC
jgi:hypothetical protein